MRPFYLQTHTEVYFLILRILVYAFKNIKPRATAASYNDYLFPNYCDGSQVKSNSASGALNKWLKANVSKEIVVHSLRHAMRDRLRAVECPANIIDQIGGWSRKGVGESYGNGYQLEQLYRWMSSV